MGKLPRGRGERDETSQIAYWLAAIFLACVRMDRKYFITACIKEEGKLYNANCDCDFRPLSEKKKKSG